MKKTIRILPIGTIAMVLLSTAVLFAGLGCSELADILGGIDDGVGAMHDFVCDYGVAADGQSTSERTTKCTQCNSGYVLVGEACELFGVQLAVVDGTVSANGATFAANATHDVSLRWVVYADGTTKTDAATVYEDAADDSTVGITRSGSDGVSLTAATPRQFSISKLSAENSYTVYVVAKFEETVVLSNVIALTTTQVGVPAFTASPVASTVTQTSATISLTAIDTEDSAVGLSWVLYDSPQSLTAEQIISNASSGVALKHNANEYIPTGDEINDTISGLLPLSTYYFYAAIIDSDGNAVRSAELTITTSGYNYECDNGVAVDSTVETSDTDGVNNCASCHDFFRKDGNNCVPTKYVCTHGTAVAGQPTAVDYSTASDKNADVNKCVSCTSGYYVDGDTAQCVSGNAYLCDNGVPVHGEAPNASTVKCRSCDSGYYVDGDTAQCVSGNAYLCDNGVPAHGEAPDTSTVKCGICNSGYSLISGGCFADGQFSRHHNGTTIVCPGVAADGSGTGEIDGVTYTRRTKDAITTANAAKTCTTGITDMSELFIDKNHFNDDIGHWDTSEVTTMSGMFLITYRVLSNYRAFNQDISNWDTSRVTDMSSMFELASSFNQEIGGWDVSNVTTMNNMFAGADLFDGDISAWRVDNVTDMEGMFGGATNFNQEIGGWNVGNVTTMKAMFAYALKFNKPINDWDVGKVTTMNSMFNGAYDFNQPMNKWNVSNVTDMSFMFWDASGFDENIGSWQVGNVTNMEQMFGGATAFNQDIGDWPVSNVTTMEVMFGGATAFNQDIGDWQVGKVTTMKRMFNGAIAFNQNLNLWDVSKVTTMEGMFSFASAFDGSIGSWQVGSVTTMEQMFKDAIAFNQDIGQWDVSKVGNMEEMFKSAEAFDKDIGQWDVTRVSMMNEMFDGASVFDRDISNWCVQPRFNTEPTDFDDFTSLGWEDGEKPDWSGDTSLNSCPINFVDQPSFDSDASTTTASAVTLKPSNSGTLYWIVYTSPNPPNSLTALKSAISSVPSATPASWAGSMVVTDDTVTTVSIDGLTDDDSYYFYAGLELVDDDGTVESDLSDTLGFTAPSPPVPSPSPSP